jgi:palmitoyltransferase|uniref:Palmitoyltransferase n=1 Tax=Panagrolaimus sp. PS1159 TaxID=55785 RepID=A0AC35GVG5_9BILA
MIEEWWNQISNDPRRCWWCKTRAFQKCFGCFIMCSDKFIRKGLGRILLFFVYGLVTFVLLMAFFVALPYESLWMPKPLMFILVIIAVYLFINILYHYHKACNTPAGRPPKKIEQDSNGPPIPICYRCQTPKDINTHHCSLCDECVVNMDHHCVWINRCVGAGNHRYFLQFTGFLALACFLYCTISFTTFYYNYWHPTSDTVFCHQSLEETFFWVPKLCSYGDEMIGASIFFAYVLCLIIFGLVGGLFLWNVLLISSGTTYIEILKGQNSKTSWKLFLFPWLKPDFADIWTEFLNLKNGRTFWRHIALPSSHRPTVPLDWGHENRSDRLPLLDV